jgi:CRP-like cAMP-binding protein
MKIPHAATLSSYTLFFEILEEFYQVSDELKSAIINSTIVVKYPKGTILFDINEIVTDAYFIYKGIARTSYFKDEREFTNSFTSEKTIFTSPSSFFTGQPSYETGELLEDSVLIKMSRNTIEEICQKHMELNYIMRRLGENFYVTLDQRTYFLHMKSAQERFENLMNANPDYFQRIPLGHIASFLGMTQETLSRLRSKVGQKKELF